jgi:glycosyltransferase involved in cell wall biosynthesis
VPAYIAAMDVAVQPDVNEYASPIKLFEYLATGRAVLAPRKANILEVVEDGVTARLFTPGDAEDLGAAIVRLHADAELRDRLGRAGAELIDARQFHWVGNARRVVELARGA